jgi:hypothetical protein
MMNCVDTTHTFIIKRMVEGMARGQVRKDIRAPITVDILRKIVPMLKHACRSSFETMLFRATFVVAFLGSFRISELVAHSVSCSGRAVRRDDIEID